MSLHPCTAVPNTPAHCPPIDNLYMLSPCAPAPSSAQLVKIITSQLDAWSGSNAPVDLAAQGKNLSFQFSTQLLVRVCVCGGGQGYAGQKEALHWERRQAAIVCHARSLVRAMAGAEAECWGVLVHQISKVVGDNRFARRGCAA